ncbi:tRNA (guanosine(37)-N1)-methyltransferase TrmD [Candidatus Uhrbacteria bacterium CG_4_9_14_3_um_filter_36_7]|uniref:tRNA (guanine-N(1)-)-methyltransferase n=1 Tax=Candidatus Uhrbacteria bacterium CG_4_9_14_3_um_filter_36_7 TaxID=1975033 RepID=A0A2M7XHA1_9BACT|nr:MAG: tRNA (guanosine(37)-N1)-methyltransferase TrmD [Candidatus Uhrbacteria bacterium CG_4_9_14_3_um_filter_36_7]
MVFCFKNMPTKKHYYDIISIFPQTIEPYLQASILGRAQTKKIVEFKAHNLRKWTHDKHHQVDDTPYGGGPGMVMMIEPFDRAIRAIRKRGKKNRIIFTSASGKLFEQKDAKRLSAYDQLIFLCGHYEGIDARVEKCLADESISIGPYVLTGGELPALVIIDSVVRLLPGVLGKEASLEVESHTEHGLLEYPQYTRPATYKWKSYQTKKIETLNVPPILLSGNHKTIEQWRNEQIKKRSQI